MININDLTEISLKDSKDKLYESIDEINLILDQDIDELMANKFLLQIVRVEAILKNWVDKYYVDSLDDSYFEIEKIQTEASMVPYSGYWTIKFDVVIPDVKGNLLLNFDEKFMLSEAFDALSTTKHNFQTNEYNSVSGEKFKIPFDDISKVYDFFLPEKTLRKFNSSKLSLTLGEKGITTPKRKI